MTRVVDFDKTPILKSKQDMLDMIVLLDGGPDDWFYACSMDEPLEALKTAIEQGIYRGVIRRPKIKDRAIA
jgi:hypothetical protein